MKNIISYCLFDQPGKKFNRNGHDKFHNVEDRYWLNIPYVLITNKHLLKDTITKIYIEKNLKNHKLYPFIHELSLKLDNFILHDVDIEFEGTEAAMWRLMPLWENDVNFFFCRDIDSVITESEANTMIHFMSSKYIINNIRAISQHNGRGASLMAGLNGFNVPKLKTIIDIPNSFQDYIAFYKKHINNSAWGCDQQTLVKFFLDSNKNTVLNNTLDVFLQPAPSAKAPFRGKTRANKFFKIQSVDGKTIKSNLNIKDKKIILMINSRSTWSGEPINASGPPLNNLINYINNDYCNIIKNEINKTNIFKEFYKI